MAAVQHAFLAAGAIFLMIQYRNVMLRGGTCVSCGGKGDHKHNCPLRDKN